MWTKIKHFLSPGAEDIEELQATKVDARSNDRDLYETESQAVVPEQARHEPRSMKTRSSGSRGAYSTDKENHDLESDVLIQAEVVDVSEPATTSLKKSDQDMLVEEAGGEDSSTNQSLPHRIRNSLPPDGNTQSGSAEGASLSVHNPATEGYDGAKQSIDDSTVQPNGNGDETNTTGTDIAPIPNSNADLEPSANTSAPQKTTMKRKRTRGVASSPKSVINAPVSTHKRFDSEEPVAEVETLESDAQDLTKNTDEEEDESEDEAPEEISGTAAAQEAKASAIKTAQSLKSQKEADRAKRQKRDLELKAQVQRSKKRKLEPSKAAVPAVKSLLRADSPVPAPGLDDDLPDELPEELLAMEYNSSEEASTVLSGSAQVLNKRKRLDQKSKPAKDIRVGNRNIRVLSSLNPSLPPAPSHQTKNMKDAWLKVRGMDARTKVAGYRIKGGGARSFLRS